MKVLALLARQSCILNRGPIARLVDTVGGGDADRIVETDGPPALHERAARGMKAAIWCTLQICFVSGFFTTTYLSLQYRQSLA
ncbi:MAG: hypothetical protein JNL87_16325 [Burkholderiaceae bacterium]|nr:hypothetical protein [Burkholderiaceae bacterium]